FTAPNNVTPKDKYVHQFLSSRSAVAPPNLNLPKNRLRQDECGKRRLACLGLNLKRLAPESSFGRLLFLFDRPSRWKNRNALTSSQSRDDPDRDGRRLHSHRDSTHQSG